MLIDTLTAKRTDLTMDLAGKWFEGFFVDFSPNGELIVYPTVDSFQVRELKSGQVWGPTGPQSFVMDVAFSPDGRHIAAVDVSGCLEIWDISTRKSIDRVEPSEDTQETFRCVAYSPSGEKIAVGTRGGVVRVWDQNGESIVRCRAITIWKWMLSPFLPRMPQFWHPAREDGRVMLWNATTGEMTGEFLGHRDAVRGMTFSRDGTRLATGSRRQFGQAMGSHNV